MCNLDGKAAICDVSGCMTTDSADYCMFTNAVGMVKVTSLFFKAGSGHGLIILLICSMNLENAATCTCGHISTSNQLLNMNYYLCLCTCFTLYFTLHATIKVVGKSWVSEHWLVCLVLGSTLVLCIYVATQHVTCTHCYIAISQSNALTCYKALCLLDGKWSQIARTFFPCPNEFLFSTAQQSAFCLSLFWFSLLLHVG